MLRPRSARRVSCSCCLLAVRKPRRALRSKPRPSAQVPAATGNSRGQTDLTAQRPFATGEAAGGYGGGSRDIRCAHRLETVLVLLFVASGALAQSADMTF